MASQKRESTKPKASRALPPDENKIDKEIEDLFVPKKPGAEEPVYDQFDKFIQGTARSKVAVIVPMYGYWVDMPDGFLDEDSLAAAMANVSSSAHTWYTIVVAESQRISHPVYDVLNGYDVAGNMRGVSMPVGSSYADYVSKGIEVALEETEAQYIVIYNPWGVIQRYGVDMMVSRVNLNGNAPVICGYDMHAELRPEEFSAYKPPQPREFLSYRAKHALSFNFMGMQRFIAEMCKVDPIFKTQPYAERDFFQQVAMKGFDVVASERVPTFVFDVPWENYVPDEWYAEDLRAFQQKWQFTPADIRLR